MSSSFSSSIYTDAVQYDLDRGQTEALRAAQTSTSGPVANLSGTSQTEPIRSMSDLPRLAPDLYKKTLMSIAGTIVRRNQHFIDHLKEINRENHE